MTPNKPESQIANSIKQLRNQLGYTLKDLSERSGLSINAIYRIENAIASPTVSTVHRLADALGVPIASLFDGSATRSTVLIRNKDREVLSMKGRTLEPLSKGLVNPLCEPFYVTIQGHVKSKVKTYQHQGEEFAYCLQGEVVYTVDGIDYHLKKGDSLVFKSDQPHFWNNPSEETAHLLVFFVACHGEKSSPKENHDQIVEEYIPNINASE